jgi:O-antigen biosynthesis protein
MTRYYCTYFDRQYLIKGLALIDSLQQHSGDDFKVFVVCADELTRLLLTKLAVPQVITIPLHQLERGDKALLATKQTRSLVEYYWTLTPTVILRILEQHPTIDVLTYLDSDLYFFSSPAPIFEELGAGSIHTDSHRLKRISVMRTGHTTSGCFRSGEMFAGWRRYAGGGSAVWNGAMPVLRPAKWATRCI